MNTKIHRLFSNIFGSKMRSNRLNFADYPLILRQSILAKVDIDSTLLFLKTNRLLRQLIFREGPFARGLIYNLDLSCYVTREKNEKILGKWLEIEFYQFYGYNKKDYRFLRFSSRCGVSSKCFVYLQKSFKRLFVKIRFVRRIQIKMFMGHQFVDLLYKPYQFDVLDFLPNIRYLRALEWDVDGYHQIVPILREFRPFVEARLSISLRNHDWGPQVITTLANFVMDRAMNCGWMALEGKLQDYHEALKQATFRNFVLNLGSLPNMLAAIKLIHEEGLPGTNEERQIHLNYIEEGDLGGAFEGVKEYLELFGCKACRPEIGILTFKLAPIRRGSYKGVIHEAHFVRPIDSMTDFVYYTCAIPKVGANEAPRVNLYVKRDVSYMDLYNL